ncbi:hypothetical protein TEA_014279 [Camellia sinensis var. sinensis]|uniref:GCF C-terminal domain-containing protein n=1 Tax=Camellia sinensis var. sinensis TaxID=542762 RepID=A0A4S4E5N7_CAMSN|nr:hypothetical protein TEA_014279 [Camellia sinensis var. sinensis]
MNIGLVKPSINADPKAPIGGILKEIDELDDDEEGIEKRGNFGRERDDATARLGSIGLGKGRDSSGSLIPDQATINAIRAKRERLRQSKAAAPDFIALDGGSNHGEAEGLSDEEPEFQSRIGFFGEKVDGGKKGVFEDVDEKATTTPHGGFRKDNEVDGGDDEDEEDKIWEEEQFRKGLGKRVDDSSSRVVVNNSVPVVQSVPQQNYTYPPAPASFSSVPSVAPSIGGAVGGFPGLDVMPISQQAEITKKALHDNLRRLKESHGRTMASLTKTDENLSSSLLNITSLEKSLSAAGEKFIFMQKLRDFVSVICKVLKSGCGHRNGGGGAVKVVGCKGRSVTVAVMPWRRINRLSREGAKHATTEQRIIASTGGLTNDWFMCHFFGLPYEAFHKAHLIEELEEQMQKLNEERAAAISERRAADNEDEMIEIEAAVNAAMSIFGKGGGSATMIERATSAAQVASATTKEQRNLPVKLDEFGRDINLQKRMDMTRRADGRRRRKARSDDKRRSSMESDVPFQRIEGESSTDESDSETAAYQSNRDLLLQTAEQVFSDAAEEYSQLSVVMEKFERWKKDYPLSYRDAYMSLSVPAIFSPYVRLELLKWDPLHEDIDFINMNWHLLLYNYGIEDENDISPDDADANLVPQLVEKVAVPILHHEIAHCWDMLSTHETKNAVSATDLVVRYVPASSEALVELVAVLHDRLADAIAKLMSFDRHQQQSNPHA